MARTKPRGAKRTRRPAASRRALPVVAPVRNAPGLGRAIPPLYRNQRETHPIVGATPERVTAALLEAMRGVPARLQDLYDDMRDRDLRLDAVCRTRTHAITSRPWRCRPPDGLEKNAEAIEIARRVQSLIKRIRAAGVATTGIADDRLGGGWQTVLSNAAGGVLTGFSVQQNDWATSAEGWHYPARVEWMHPNRFTISQSLELCYSGVGIGVAGGGQPLSSYGRDRFIVHAPSGGRASYITRSGPLLSCVMPALTKRLGMRWLMTTAERFGTPLPYATVPAGSSSGGTNDLADSAKAMLRAFTADWQAVVTEGIKLDVVPMTGTATGEVHARIVDLANTDYAIQLLGQNLNAEVKGGSYAAATAGNVMRMDLLAGDLAELDDTLTMQLVEPIVRYNWPGAPVPIYETEIAPKSSKEIFAYHIAAGVVTADEVRAGLGLDPLPNAAGAALIPAVQTGPAAVPGGALAGDPFVPGTPKSMQWQAEMLARHGTSPTRSTSMHPLAQALRRSSDGLAS